jgi:predicted MFS family arabinose efflux permease
MSLFYNWSYDTLHIRPEQLGVVESFREFPGLLIFLVAALTARIAEPRLGGVALLMFGLGLAAYSRVTGMVSLVIISLFWSAGLHTWMPLSSSIALRLAEEGKQGRRLGQIGAAGSLGTLFGMGIVRALAGWAPYDVCWYAAGILAIAAAVIILRVSGGQSLLRPRFVFKRKYSVYYGLTLLEGCRKQVFITFAVFILVKEFGSSLKAISGLMILNNALGFFLAPKVGRLIDRIGERRVLMTSYTLLIGVFLGYAFFRNIHALYAMYILDSLLFLTAVGNSTYLKKIAEPDDITPSLATGVTMNHIAAVAVPITGGLMWQTFGYRPVFIGGAVVVLLSIFCANRMRVPSSAKVAELETVEPPTLAEY